MLKDAIDELYSEFPYNYTLKYSGKFKPFRANVKLRGGHMEFALSRRWKRISKDIQIGLVQELLLKIMKKRLKPLKTQTYHIELYNFFMKKIHIAVPKDSIDPFLEESFDRVNSKYFYGILEKTNLKWGHDSLSKLGSYEYGTDTITMSKVLEDVPLEILDYIMYHEMLHKKHKFTKKGGKSYHHTTAFKKDEMAFEDSSLIEKQLRKLLVKKRFSFRNILKELF